MKEFSTLGAWPNLFCQTCLLQLLHPCQSWVRCKLGIALLGFQHFLPEMLLMLPWNFMLTMHQTKQTPQLESKQVWKHIKIISKFKWETLAACSHCEQHLTCRLGSSKSGCDGPAKWSWGPSGILLECHKPLKVQRRWTAGEPGIEEASSNVIKFSWNQKPKMNNET